MKFLLRADADVTRGSGHMMRCLTLAEALIARGHVVELMGHIVDVPWLASLIRQSGITVRPCGRDELDVAQIAQHGYDRVVVDSYWIDAVSITALDRIVPVCAIVDHGSRGIGASWYLDQNLGAEDRDWPTEVSRRLLAGSRYVLVRDAVIAQRRSDGWRLPAQPKAIAFMGGTDPSGIMIGVARSIAAALPALDLTCVATAVQAEAVRAATSHMRSARTVAPTADLPRLLGGSDLVVCAAGTSAWDVCTMGRPSVVVAVVDNQTESLARAVADRLVLGVDAINGGEDEIGGLLARLIQDEPLRIELVRNATREFDGLGKLRVAQALEQAPTEV